MISILLRGRTLSFERWPQTIDDHSAWRYEEDGGLLIGDGRIVAAGAYADVEKQAGEAVKKSTTGRICCCPASSTRMRIFRRCRSLLPMAPNCSTG